MRATGRLRNKTMHTLRGLTRPTAEQALEHAYKELEIARLTRNGYKAVALALIVEKLEHVIEINHPNWTKPISEYRKG